MSCGQFFAVSLDASFRRWRFHLAELWPKQFI
jgi:hypothetical protein